MGGITTKPVVGAPGVTVLGRSKSAKQGYALISGSVVGVMVRRALRALAALSLVSVGCIRPWEILGLSIEYCKVVAGAADIGSSQPFRIFP